VLILGHSLAQVLVQVLVLEQGLGPVAVSMVAALWLGPVAVAMVAAPMLAELVPVPSYAGP